MSLISIFIVENGYPVVPPFLTRNQFHSLVICARGRDQNTASVFLPDALARSGEKLDATRTR